MRVFGDDFNEGHDCQDSTLTLFGCSLSIKCLVGREISSEGEVDISFIGI